MRYVALLGGINVGGHRVKMTELRSSFEALGFQNVASFIASGNVLFDADSMDAPGLAAQIEHRLAQQLGYKVPTFLRSLAELQRVATYQPFPSTTLDPGVDTLSILFLAAPLPTERHSALRSFRTAMDEFHIHQREIYWLCRGKTSDSLVNWPLMSKQVALPAVTVRNASTIRKLVAKHAAEA
jgi:uncharacterized protein (DUF1697 family)